MLENYYFFGGCQQNHNRHFYSFPYLAPPGSVVQDGFRSANLCYYAWTLSLFVNLILVGVLGRYAESCVHKVVRQMIGWFNIIILISNISYKRDGVDSFGQIPPSFISHLNIFSILEVDQKTMNESRMEGFAVTKAKEFTELCNIWYDVIIEKCTFLILKAKVDTSWLDDFLWNNKTQCIQHPTRTTR